MVKMVKSRCFFTLDRWSKNPNPPSVGIPTVGHSHHAGQTEIRNPWGVVFLRPVSIGVLSFGIANWDMNWLNNVK